MKFEIKTKICKEIIRKVSSLVPTFSVLPEESGVLINVFETRIVFKAKNEYVSIKTELNNLESLHIHETGKILIKGKMLNDIVSKMNSETIMFNQVDENILILKSEDSDYELNLLNSENYNDFEINYEGEEGEGFVIPGDKFLSSINKTMIAVNEFHPRKTLQGINIKQEWDKLFFIGTDGNRVQRVIFDSKTVTKINHIINIRSLKELVKILNNSSKELRIKFNNFYGIIEDGMTLIKTKVLDGSFPDVSKPFNLDFKNSLKVDRELFLDALDRVTILNTKSNNDQIALKLIINNGIMRLETRESEIGYSSVKLEKYYFSDEGSFSIAFNPKFMIEALKSFNSKEIEFKMISAELPIYVTGVDAGTSKVESIILPLRTN